jgi:hypothetical protein
MEHKKELGFVATIKPALPGFRLRGNDGKEIEIALNETYGNL